MLEFLIIFIILIDLLIIGIIFSKITINIDNCNIYSNNNLKKIIADEVNINISLYLYKVIKIINIKLYRKYLKIFGIKINYKKILKLKNETIKRIINFIKLLIGNDRIKLRNLKPEIQNYYMDLTIGTKNAAFTSMIVSTISAFTAIGLKSFTKKLNSNKYYYKVNPVFFNTNGFKLELKTKVNFNVMKIIELIYDYYMVKNARQTNKHREKNNKKIKYEKSKLYIANNKIKKLFSKTREYGKINM